MSNVSWMMPGVRCLLFIAVVLVGCGPQCTCPEGDYCHYDEGKCGGEGTCTPRGRGPVICPASLAARVCGCDGETYECDSAAEVAGVSIAYRGTCK